jgi:hypothetical protein
MAKKLICLQNFTCSDLAEDHLEDGDNKTSKHHEWVKGEEYTGKDDAERLQEEGLIGEDDSDAPAKAKGKKAAKGKKKAATDLGEGEGITPSGDEAGETVPATGKEPDGEEELDGDDDDVPPPAKPAKKAAAKGKGGGKKR